MANYKIIGGDQKEYGPATADELRRWIAEGRLNKQSFIRVEDSSEWKPLGDFSEFADALRAQTVPSISDVPPISSEVWSAQILARPSEVPIGRCLANSWKLMTENFGLLLGATCLVWLISVICQALGFVPILGIFAGFVPLLLHGVLYGGLYLIFLKRIRRQAAFVGEVFAGFTLDFVQLMLVGFISALLSGIASVFCAVPGIYLMVAWIFCIPLVADKRLEFWSAMELSRKVVTRVWFDILVLILIAFLPVILANLYMGIKIGMVVFTTVMDMMNSGQPDPRRIMAVIVHLMKTSAWLVAVTKIVLLFNLPFALGALMYAYENLFGARPAAAP